MLLIFASIGLLTIYLLGGFSSNIEYQSTYCQHSFFRADGLIFLETKGLSNINSICSISENSQMGGYPGAGVLFLFVISLVYVKNMHRKNIDLALFFVLTFILVYTFSMFPVFKINNTMLYEINLSQHLLIKNFLDIFRANGRFIVIDVYLLIVFSLIFISKLKNYKIIILVLMTIFLQGFDLSKYYINKLSYFRVKQEFFSKIFLPKEFDLQKKIIILDENFFIGERRDNDMYLADFAYKNNLRLTYFYFAREIKNRNDYFQFKLKNPQKYDIFVFSSKYIKSENFTKNSLACSKLVKENYEYFCEI